MKIKVKPNIKIVAKSWCQFCRAPTMVKKEGRYAEHYEIWECSKCRLVDEYHAD
jgi:ribosomal protein L37AE/L43A